MLGLARTTAQAIRALDEHWDGKATRRLAGDEIPLLGRILCLAQTVEVFYAHGGAARRLRVARARRGTWFDPEIVDALARLERDRAFWDARWRRAARVWRLEPADRVQPADDARLDLVAEAFAGVIDAKSPYTRATRAGVAEHRGARSAPRSASSPRAARPAPRRPAARHRQARRLEPDPRQARQAPTPSDGAMRLHPRLTFRSWTASAPSAPSRYCRPRTTSGWTAAATTRA